MGVRIAVSTRVEGSKNEHCTHLIFSRRYGDCGARPTPPREGYGLARHLTRKGRCGRRPGHGHGRKGVVLACKRVSQGEHSRHTFSLPFLTYKCNCSWSRADNMWPSAGVRDTSTRAREPPSYSR